MKKIKYIVFALLIPVITMAQTSSSGSGGSRNYFGIAVGANASSNGLGGDIAVSMLKWLDVRVGYEKLGISMSPMSLSLSGQNFNLTPTISTGGWSAIADINLLGGLYVAGGAYLTSFNPSFKIMTANPLTFGAITYTPNDIGELDIAVKPQNKLAPYVGLGFGTNIPRNHRFSMNFEIGAYNMGSYVVETSGTNLFAGNSNNESITQLNTMLKGFSWSGIYPVIKLGISYKFFGSTK